MSLIIDAGHQGVGFDPGAIGNGIIEADLVLKISLYQYDRFKELGVPVKITRTKTQKLTNSERAKLVKNSKMKHCISNHINAGGGDGAEVIYSIHSKPTFAQIVLDALTAVGQNSRKIFTRKSNNSYHDYYYMHRDTGAVETIIVEYGFLDSKKDDVHQLKNDWQKYAEAVVKAYCSFAGYKYKTPKVDAETNKGDNGMLKFSSNTFKNEMVTFLENAHKRGLLSSHSWINQAKEGKLSKDDTISLIVTIMNRSEKSE